jgi:hypothetical protein
MKLGDFLPFLMYFNRISKHITGQGIDWEWILRQQCVLSEDLFLLFNFISADTVVSFVSELSFYWTILNIKLLKTNGRQNDKQQQELPPRQIKYPKPTKKKIYIDRSLCKSMYWFGKGSNIPATPAYGVYISQLIRYVRARCFLSGFPR